MHASSYKNMKKFIDMYIPTHGHNNLHVLDIGSHDFNGSYKPLFECCDYRGLDLCPGRNVDIVVGDPYHWDAISSGSFDVVVSGQAFEHIEFFWEVMLEITRVLKAGGLCCIIAPSTGPRHSTEGGKDCWRFMPEGLEAMAKWAGLEVIEAYIGWESIGNAEDDQWKDAVLICRKPAIGGA